MMKRWTICRAPTRLRNSQPEWNRYFHEEIIVGLREQKFKRIVVFTGAGVSTDSGLPCFRDGSGLSETIEPSVFDDNDDNGQKRKKKVRFAEQVERAEPNSIHHFVADLHRAGLLLATITQNVDGLHQKAGLPEHMVIECHGSMSCGNVVRFGQTLFREQELRQKLADLARQKPDLILVLGTSLQVEPFCCFPNLAPRSCTRVWITRGLHFYKRRALCDELFLRYRRNPTAESCSHLLNPACTDDMRYVQRPMPLRLDVGWYLSRKDRWWESGDHPHYKEQWCVDAEKLSDFIDETKFILI